VLKWVIKIIFHYFKSFALLIINVKILANFKKEWCTFDRKIGSLRKNNLDYPLLKFKCFENEKIILICGNL
jgi:hypothetical protein